MLHSMTIRLIHVHQLGPSTYVIGSNTNLGSFGVTGVKRSFSLKMIWYYSERVLFQEGPKGYFCERMGFREVRL